MEHAVGTFVFLSSYRILFTAGNYQWVIKYIQAKKSLMKIVEISKAT